MDQLVTSASILNTNISITLQSIKISASEMIVETSALLEIILECKI